MNPTLSACSFCGKPSTQVRDLIGSRRLSAAYICDQCIDICRVILDEDRAHEDGAGSPAVSAAADSVQNAGESRSQRQALECSFCRRPQHNVNSLISSPREGARQYICDRCVWMGAEVLGTVERRALSRPQRLAQWLKRRLRAREAPLRWLP